MTNNKQIALNERIGRNALNGYVSTNTLDCTLHRWSKNETSSWDVSYYTGTTKDMIIGEIKFREGYNEHQFNDWILEGLKLAKLQELKRITEQKFPNRNVFIHYIVFYKDNLKVPRIWDITNIDPTTFETSELPNMTCTTSQQMRDKPATKLHNNDTINLLNLNE